MKKPGKLFKKDLEHPKGQKKSSFNGDVRRPADEQGFSERRKANGVTVTHGTKPQSRSKLVEGPHMGLDNKIVGGGVHRNTVREYKHPDYNHEPFTTVHRPGPDKAPLPPLSDRQKRMMRGGDGRKK